jgi:hypothetical protein
MRDTMRDILNKLSQIENYVEQDLPEIGDAIGFSFSPDFEVVTEVVGFTEDGIVVELDETGLQHLEENGTLFLEGELIYEEKQKGIDGKACWKGYKRMGTKMKGGKRVDNCVKVGEGKFDFDDEDDSPEDPEKDKVQHIVMQARKAYDVEGNYPITFKDGSKAKLPLPMIVKFLKMYNMLKTTEKEEFSNLASQSPKDFEAALQKDVTPKPLPKIKGNRYMSSFSGDFPESYNDVAEGSDDLSKISTEKLQAYWNKHKDESGIGLAFGEKLKAVARELARRKKQGMSEADVDEAKYQGKEVPLGKKLPGDVKKSKVYVRKPNGKVVKVNFGDKKMRIKKSNPARRKSFRARHNCKNPGPRWKARYWSCRSW